MTESGKSEKQLSLPWEGVKHPQAIEALRKATRDNEIRKVRREAYKILKKLQRKR